MSSKRIAIIGAGPSGLTAIKQCLEYGHTVTCFEKTGDIGGLWRYHDEDLSGIPSVAKNTIINTSKEISAFSDFPPPNKFPNYMPHFLMLKYLEMYVDHFKLRPHVKLNHEVLWIRKADDHSRTGRWVVKFKYDDNVMEEIFDGVMICNGHHVYPRMARFPGQDKFKGEITHTHSYKKPDRYVDKKVVIIGFGNSALDAAVEIARVAKQVYLSTRRGSWVVSRNFIKGLPLDYWLSCRIVQTFAKTFGKTWSFLMESLLNFYLDHEKYGIKPKHRYCNQHPSICDELAHWVISGRVLIRKNIKEFTEDGVKFEDSDETVEIDSVVMGTGYDVGCPFLDSSVLDVVDNRVELYKNVFNPKLDHPQTLAFIGLVQPLGAVFPVSEMQSRWFAALMKGEISLPSKSHMLQDIERVDKERWSRFYQSPRNAIEVDHMLFMDSIAEQIGCKPNLLLLALKDPKLWYHLIFGPGVSYQYRLMGSHSWPGAREAIINVDERLIEALKPSKLHSITDGKSKEYKEYSNGVNGTNGLNGTNGINGVNGYHNGLNGHHYQEPEE